MITYYLTAPAEPNEDSPSESTNKDGEAEETDKTTSEVLECILLSKQQFIDK